MDFSGKNLPNSKELLTLYLFVSSIFLSETFFSRLPKPTVLIEPANATLPTSAKFNFICIRDAQPPCSLKSVNLNSLTQISTLFETPSSTLLRIPIIIELISPKFGFPFTETLF